MNECDMNFIVQSLACMISIHNILTSYADDFYFQNNQKIPLWWLKTMIRMKPFHISFICDHLTRTKLQTSRRNFWNYFVVCLFVCLFVWSGVQITLCFKVRNIQASGNQGAATRTDQSAYRVPSTPLPTNSLNGPLSINTNSLVSGGARLHE